MKTPHEFYSETNGKIIDVDGYYGGQCWDLFALFCQEYCNRIFGCIETSYVIDLWNKFDEVGLGEYFERVYNWKDFRDGDWVIWKGPCMITNASHIAMFRIDEPNTGGGIFLTQNPDGDPKYTHQMWISYNNYVGALRPKCYITQDKNLPTPVERDINKNQFKINCDDTMNIRLDHTTGAESIGFGKIGYYDVEPINMASQDGYQWYEIEKGKWCALIPPFSEFVGIEQETPQNQEKVQDSPIIPEQPKTLENGQKEEKIEHNDNIFIKIIKFIIELIKKIFTYKS